MPKRKTRKKTKKKVKKAITTSEENLKQKTEINELKNELKNELLQDSTQKTSFKTDKLSNSNLQPSYSELEQENKELRAILEKAKKKLRIYSKKLDSAEEREEQWKITCYAIAGIFAEKSQLSLEDILKRYEAPVDEIIM